MSDGSSSRSKKSKNVAVIDTHLYTQGLDQGSVGRIEEGLHDLGPHTGRGVECRGTSGIAITILQDSVNLFMDIIEPFIVPSFQYKIKRKDRTGK